MPRKRGEHPDTQAQAHGRSPEHRGRGLRLKSPTMKRMAPRTSKGRLIHSRHTSRLPGRCWRKHASHLKKEGNLERLTIWVQSAGQSLANIQGGQFWRMRSQLPG